MSARADTRLRHPCECLKNPSSRYETEDVEEGLEVLGSPEIISRGKPLSFASVRAAAEEMPLAAQSCMPPVITSNLIGNSSAIAGDQPVTCGVQITPD